MNSKTLGFALLLHLLQSSAEESTKQQPHQLPAVCRFLGQVRGQWSPQLQASVQCCALGDPESVTKCLTHNRNKKIAADACEHDVAADWRYQQPKGLSDMAADKASILLFSLPVSWSRAGPLAQADLRAWLAACCQPLAPRAPYDCFKRKALSHVRDLA